MEELREKEREREREREARKRKKAREKEGHWEEKDMSDEGTPLDCIGDALQVLWGQIEETSTQVKSLDKVAREMKPSMPDEEETKEMNEIPEDRTGSEYEQEDVIDKEQEEKIRIGQEERYIIELLERERIEAVIDMQKQDYIGSVLEELIRKNDEIVNEVTVFFKKDKMEKKELDGVKSEQRQRRRTMDSVGKDIDANIAYLHLGMREKEEEVLEAVREIGAKYDTQLIPEYKAKLEDIIKSIKRDYLKLPS